MILILPLKRSRLVKETTQKHPKTLIELKNSQEIGFINENGGQKRAGNRGCACLVVRLVVHGTALAQPLVHGDKGDVADVGWGLFVIRRGCDGGESGVEHGRDGAEARAGLAAAGRQRAA